MWSRPGLTVSDALEAQLRVMYATPPRAYHNASHIDEVLARFDECRPLLEDVESVFYALLFHDAIYVAGQVAIADAPRSWRAWDDLRRRGTPPPGYVLAESFENGGRLFVKQR